MDGVLQKANITCRYENIKSAIQTATNRWITSLIKGYPEDLSEFIENVVKREFNFDADATYSLKNCNSIALINCPHANIKIGQLTLNGKIKKKENYAIEFWFNKCRVKHNPEDNFLSVFHKEKYGVERKENVSLERKDSMSSNKSSSKVMSSMSSVDGGSKEFLEIAVLKRAKDRRSFGKLVFKEDRRNELQDSFKGRLILPLTKAFEFNQKQHTWSLMMGGVNVGEIELTFDFTNQDMISAHEMFISQISNKVLDNFNELWKLHEPVSSQRNESICPSITNKDNYVQQPPLTCHVEATLVATTKDSATSNENLEQPENDKEKVDSEEKLEIRINSKLVESDILVGTHFLIPVHSFRNDVISLTIPIKDENESEESTADDSKRRSRKISLLENREKVEPLHEKKASVTTLPVRNIPWKGGQIISIGGHQWRLEFVCGDSEFGDSEGDGIAFVDIVKCLVFLLFYNQLKKKEGNEICWWNGRLGGNLISIVSVIYPFFTGKEWETIESWALLKLSPFFDGLNLRLIHQALKYVQNKQKDKRVADIIRTDEKHQILEPIASYCLDKLLAFNSRDIEEKVTKASKRSLLKSPYDDTRAIVRNLILIYEDCCKVLLEKLSSEITASLGQEYEPWKENFNDVPFSELLMNISNFEKNLSNITYYFGYFGRAVWSSILATRFLEIMLPLIKQRMEAINKTNSTEIQQEHTNLFLTFKRVKSILPHCTQDQEIWSKKIHTLFSPYLTAWSQLIVTKAENQITRVIQLEKEKFTTHNFNDPIKDNHARDNKLLSVIFEGNEEDPYPDFDTELEGARDVRGIFQTCVQAWENLEWDEMLKKIEFGITVFLKLHYLFNYYIEGLKEMVLGDQSLSLDELVYVLKSLFHLRQEYIEIFWKKLDAQITACPAGKSLLDKDSSDLIIAEITNCVEDIIYTLIQRFSIEKQQYFNQLLVCSFSAVQDEAHSTKRNCCGTFTEMITDAFVACIKKGKDAEEDGISLVTLQKQDPFEDRKTMCLLKDNDPMTIFKMEFEDMISEFEHKVRQILSKSDIDEKVVNKVRSDFKRESFEVGLGLIKYFYSLTKETYSENKNIKSYYSLKELLTIDRKLREKFNVKEDPDLIKMEEETKLKISSSSMVISNYLNCLHDQTFSKDSHAGTLAYRGGVVDGKNLVILLKSVTDLRPRVDQETCNFSIEAFVLPDEKDNPTKQSTTVHKGKTFHLFDMMRESFSDEGEIESEEQLFSFPLFNQDESSTPLKKFIEFRVLDHANTLFRKQEYLLGHVIQPLDIFPHFATIEEFKAATSNTMESVFKNYSIHDLVDGNTSSDNEQLILYWNELKCRHDVLASKFLRTQNIMETLSTE